MNHDNTENNYPSLRLDLRRPLYDSFGARHFAVQTGGLQLITRARGLFFVWDAKDGTCQLRGLDRLRLSNQRPSASLPEPGSLALAHGVLAPIMARARRTCVGGGGASSV